MGHPKRDAKLRTALRPTLKTRQIGQPEAGPQDIRNSQTEDNKRRRFDEAVAAPTPQAAVGAPQAPQAPVIPPAPAIGPDRFHKQGSDYCIVARDHLEIAGDLDIIPNPGYRTVGVTESTINDAYARAKDQVTRLDPGRRYRVFICGGTWNEDLVLDDPRIDIIGWGRPVINTPNGWLIKHNVPTIRLNDLRIIAGRPTVDITAVVRGHLWGPQALSIEPPTGDPADMDLLFDESGIEIDNCYIEGYTCAFATGRRVYSRDSHYKVLLTDLENQNEPAVFIAAQPLDLRPSIFEGGSIQGRLPYPPLPTGFAVRMTAQTDLMGTNFYRESLMTQTGVVFTNGCKIIGRTSLEGWRAIFTHAKGYASGSAFINLVGMPLGSDMTSIVIFDHTPIRASVIGNFDGPFPNSISSAFFRTSSHLNSPTVGGLAAQAFGATPMAGLGNLWIVNSSTGSLNWGTAGGGPPVIEVDIRNSTVNQPVVNMHDEYFFV